LFASFRRVLAIDPGFRPEGVLTANVVLPRTRYADEKALIAFTNEALRRIRALPGVVSAGAGDMVPLDGDHSDSVILAEGYQSSQGRRGSPPTRSPRPPGFSGPPGCGRPRAGFSAKRAAAGAPPPFTVAGKRARRFWPDRDPIGRRMYLPQDINDLLAI